MPLVFFEKSIGLVLEQMSGENDFRNIPKSGSVIVIFL